LVHDVFLALWRDRAHWHVTTSMRLWLYGAVRNRAMNHLRHERVVSQVVQRDAPIAMGAPPADAHAEVEARELDERVDRALANVSERRRIALTLRWRHDFSPAEIANVLGTTPEAVRVLLVRARQDLASIVGER
jgi:RNA polymerase sigma-70 factor (ECF subfamily)